MQIPILPPESSEEKRARMKMEDVCYISWGAGAILRSTKVGRCMCQIADEYA